MRWCFSNVKWILRSSEETNVNFCLEHVGKSSWVAMDMHSDSHHFRGGVRICLRCWVNSLCIHESVFSPDLGGRRGGREGAMDGVSNSQKGCFRAKVVFQVSTIKTKPTIKNKVFLKWVWLKTVFLVHDFYVAGTRWHLAMVIFLLISPCGYPPENDGTVLVLSFMHCLPSSGSDLHKRPRYLRWAHSPWLHCGTTCVEKQSPGSEWSFTQMGHQWVELQATSLPTC